MLVKIGRSTFDSYSAAVNEMNDKLQNYISSKSEHMVCFDREPEGEIILFMEESKEKMEEDAKDLADFLENMLSEKPEIGYFGSVGSPVSRIREISQAYETAAHAFAYRFLVEGNQILRFEQIDRKPVLMERADGEYHVGKINFGGLDKTRIKAFLRGGDSEEIPIFVEEYLENAGDACQNSLIFRQYIVMDMYVAASHFLEQLGDSEEFSRKEPFESPVQTVLAAIQRQMRLIIPDGVVQPRNIVPGNVGRVADDALKFTQRPVGPLQRVDLHGNHPGGQAAAADILPADLQRGIRILPQYASNAGGMGGDGQSDTAAPGAQVQHPAGAKGLDIRQRLIHQHLRIRPGKISLFYFTNSINIRFRLFQCS